MIVKYTKDRILQDADLAKRYETSGHTVGLGNIILAAVSDVGEHADRYNAIVNEVVDVFPEKHSSEIKDYEITVANQVFAIHITDKKVKVIISSDLSINDKLVKGLDLGVVTSCQFMF